MKTRSSLAGKAFYCVLAAAVVMPTQAQTKDDFSANKYEIDIFGGAQLFHKRPDPLQSKLLNSTVIGMHVTQNVWRYWSLEESFSGTTLADLTLQTFPGSQKKLDFEQRVMKLSFNPVYHVAPAGSRFRPFLTIGPTVAFFHATGDGQEYARNLPTPLGFNSDTKLALNYGGGLKIRFSELAGMRFDVRGLWSGAPNWGLPYASSGPGSVYIPKGGSIHGIEATVGLMLHLGGRKAAPPPPPPPPPPPVKPVEPSKPARVFELARVQADPTNVWQGENIRFRCLLNDSYGASGIVYAWFVDGVKQSGAPNSPEWVTALPVGTHTVTCTATDPGTGTTATAEGVTVTVRPIPPLTITIAADKSVLKTGDSARVSAQASESEYGGRTTITWSTNVGSIRGSGASVNFDSSTVTFDPANVFKAESRTATITATATDARGRRATSNSVQIRVDKDPQLMRLDDVIYGKGSSRVNNCAKRILIDELQGLMNSNPDVEVLLVGHIDDKESAAAQLDRQRVYNAAAVLTAGTGVCAKCDLARIKVAFAGKDQSSEFRSGFCGTSTRQKSDERKADEIAADDAAAKNRRVEIWIVPKGVAMPAGAKNVQAAPVNVIKAKGCPK